MTTKRTERIYPKHVQTGDILVLRRHGGGSLEAIVTNIWPEGRTWGIETATTEGVLVDYPQANAKVARVVR